MGTVGWLTRHHIRHRSVALTGLALVTALGTAGTLVAVGAADRTAGAYAAYRERARVGDVVVNPSLVSTEVDRLVRELPGVEQVTSDALFTAGIDPNPRPRTQAELDADPQLILVRGSIDGRYLEMDRPALTEGRMATGRKEAFVTLEAAEANGFDVGDVVPLSFWSRRTEAAGIEEPLPPIGVEQVTVVGIGTLSDEVLPDGLYPRQTMILSPDLAERYDCIPDEPARDATLEEAIFQLAPVDCATSYRFYSLGLRGGDGGVAAVLDAFTRGAAELDDQLPASLQEIEVGYTLVAATTTGAEEQRVERSTQPLVVALGVLAAAAAFITLLVVALGVARELVRSDRDQATWWRLGVGRRERLQVLVLPLLAAAGAGLLVGTVAAWLLSTAAPVGSVRSIDPSPDRRLAGLSWLVVLGFALALLATVSVLCWRAAGRVGRQAPRPSVAARRLVPGSDRPEITEGLHAAYPTTRGAGLVLASGGTAVGVFVAAVVFGASLSSLLSTPASYGWTWDLASVDNFGYGGTELDAVRESLDGRDDVDAWTALGFSNSLALDDTAVPAVLAYDRSSTVDLPVVEGRLPHADDEIALGARTAADLGLDVGDTVGVGGYEVPPTTARVTGIVVLPALGPFRADRTAPGVGALVPEAMLDPELANGFVTFVGVDLTESADSAATFADLRGAFASWNPSALLTFDLDAPVRPSEIIDARSMRSSPMLVGGLLVVGATLGLAIGVAMSVRARRRDLAVARVLGFTRRQLRDSVLVQSVASATGAVVIGVPLGMAIGNLAWRAFASRLGVDTQPATPIGWILLTILGAALVALAAAAWPARSAARTRPAVTLRAT